jgi:hypothetical protein
MSSANRVPPLKERMYEEPQTEDTNTRNIFMMAPGGPNNNQNDASIPPPPATNSSALRPKKVPKNIDHKDNFWFCHSCWGFWGRDTTPYVENWQAERNQDQYAYGKGVQYSTRYPCFHCRGVIKVENARNAKNQEKTTYEWTEGEYREDNGDRWIFVGSNRQEVEYGNPELDGMFWVFLAPLRYYRSPPHIFELKIKHPQMEDTNPTSLRRIRSENPPKVKGALRPLCIVQPRNKREGVNGVQRHTQTGEPTEAEKIR